MHNLAKVIRVRIRWFVVTVLVAPMRSRMEGEATGAKQSQKLCIVSKVKLHGFLKKVLAADLFYVAIS